CKRDCERLAIALSRARIGCVEQLAPCRSEDGQQRVHTVGPRRCRQGARRLFGCCKRARVVLPRGAGHRQQNDDGQAPANRARVHRRLPPPPDRPPALRLRLPRELAARSRLPLEYPEKASDRVPLRSTLPWRSALLRPRDSALAVVAEVPWRA